MDDHHCDITKLLFKKQKLAQMTNIPNMAQCLEDYVLNTPTHFFLLLQNSMYLHITLQLLFVLRFMVRCLLQLIIVFNQGKGKKHMYNFFKSRCF